MSNILPLNKCYFNSKPNVYNCILPESLALCYFNYLISQFSPIFIDKIKHIKENHTDYGRIPYEHYIFSTVRKKKKRVMNEKAVVTVGQCLIVAFD